MPIKSKYLFVASMDVDPDKEALFHKVYDTEHVPNLLKVPGVHAVTRLEGEPFAMSIGGEEKKVVHEGARHSAFYEIDGPHVLISPEWAKAPLANPGAAVYPQPASHAVPGAPEPDARLNRLDAPLVPAQAGTQVFSTRIWIPVCAGRAEAKTSRTRRLEQR